MGDNGKRYTRRNTEATSFAERLCIVPTGDLPIPDYVQHHYVRHNRAVQDWQKRRVGAMSNSQPQEWTILDYAYAAWSLLNEHRDGGELDGYMCEHVARPMGEAWSNMLNLDLGRLDGGTLSEWGLEVFGEE